MATKARALAFGLCACVSLALVAGATADTGSLAEGSLVGWGQNSSGECNVPTGYYVQVSAGGFGGLALRLDGNAVAWGLNTDGQNTIPSGRFSQVSSATGGSFSLALRTDGNLVGWGWNGEGECNVPAGTYTQVSAGGSHGLAIKSTGALAAWGYNASGECNVPTGTNYTQVAAGLFHSLALRSDGNVVAWGNKTHGECNVPVGTFKQVAAGFFTSYGLKTNGSLAAWGDNGDGECNVPVGTNFVQVAAGDLHALAVRSDGTMAAWGYNGYGECNVPTAGFYLSAAGGWGFSIGLVARTSYQDLLVSGTGNSALLQRNISVTGDMTVQTGLNLANNPTVTIAGKMRIAGGGAVTLGACSLAYGGADSNLRVRIDNDGNLRVSSGSFQVGRVSGFDSNLLTGMVQVDAGCSLSAVSLRQHQATVNGALTLSGSRTTSCLDRLTIAGSTGAWTGKVDIGTNFLFIKEGNVAVVQNQVLQGSQNGWTGTGGVLSGAVADSLLVGIGFADNAILRVSAFGDANGLPPQGVVMRYTYMGDTNLDGIADLDNDYYNWSFGYLNEGYDTWYYGDFNYDGVVDLDKDYYAWSYGYLNQGPPLAAQEIDSSAPAAGPVPEPLTLTLLALGVAMLPRRARKHA